MDVEEFDADLASASEAEDEPMIDAIAHPDESDDDIDFDDGLALPPSQAPVPTPSMQAYQSPAINTGGVQSTFNNDAGVVSSEEEDEDDDDEEDFADLANDLETSLEPTALQQQASAAQARQPAQVPVPARSAGQSVGKNGMTTYAKKYDSDLASSSESDEDG